MPGMHAPAAAGPAMQRPEIQGHRGARARRPENTLPGLACALAAGVDVIEFDVTLTADYALILAHDLHVNPVTIRGRFAGAPWRSLTLAQVATLEAGYRSPPAPFEGTFVAVPGTGVPTLDQVARLITESGAEHVTLAVELKTSPDWDAADVARLTRLALDVLLRNGLASRSRMLAFNWQVLLTARTEAAQIPRVALIDPATWVPGSPWLAGLDPAGFGADATGLAGVSGCAEAAASVAAAWLSPWDPMCDAGLIGAAHDRGLKVVPWSVNEPGRMAELTGLGADAIITDDPAILRAELGRAGAALPAAASLPWPSGVPDWAPRPFPA
jgi:glycerophosphoryl diester phosphodiesterase